MSLLLFFIVFLLSGAPLLVLLGFFFFTLDSTDNEWPIVAEHDHYLGEMDNES